MTDETDLTQLRDLLAIQAAVVPEREAPQDAILRRSRALKRSRVSFGAAVAVLVLASATAIPVLTGRPNRSVAVTPTASPTTAASTPPAPATPTVTVAPSADVRWDVPATLAEGTADGLPWRLTRLISPLATMDVPDAVLCPTGHPPPTAPPITAAPSPGTTAIAVCFPLYYDGRLTTIAGGTSASSTQFQGLAATLAAGGTSFAVTPITAGGTVHGYLVWGEVDPAVTKVAVSWDGGVYTNATFHLAPDENAYFVVQLPAHPQRLTGTTRFYDAAGKPVPAGTALPSTRDFITPPGN